MAITILTTLFALAVLVTVHEAGHFAAGKTFKIIGDWTTRANAHRLIECSWIGTTDFREVAEFIDDDSDEEVEER